MPDTLCSIGLTKEKKVNHPLPARVKKPPYFTYFPWNTATTIRNFSTLKMLALDFFSWYTRREFPVLTPHLPISVVCSLVFTLRRTTTSDWVSYNGACLWFIQMRRSTAAAAAALQFLLLYAARCHKTVENLWMTSYSTLLFTAVYYDVIVLLQSTWNIRLWPVGFNSVAAVIRPFTRYFG